MLARINGSRQFARGGRRVPHEPLLLLYALARLKHDRQTEIRFNATEAIVNSLLRSYGPWGSGAHVSYPYGRPSVGRHPRIALFVVESSRKLD